MFTNPSRQLAVDVPEVGERSATVVPKPFIDPKKDKSYAPRWDAALKESSMRYVRLLPLCALLPAMQIASDAGPPPEPAGEWASTFSIVAYDPGRKEWGVAVASKYLAVGSAVPHARAQTGAVATQALVRVSYGPEALALLAKGKSAKETLDEILAADKGKEFRQLGLVDAKGEVAQHTGKNCLAWAGGKTGKHFACQGNLLKGPEVIDAMAKAYEEAKGPLAWKLMLALEAGDKAGGDKRGKQSAGLIVVREGAGPNGFGDRYIDFRVDDHKEPVTELARILGLRVKRP